jgi:hypothetical protein
MARYPTVERLRGWVSGQRLITGETQRVVADGADNTYEDRRDDSFVGGQRTLCPHNIDEGLPDACIWEKESQHQHVEGQMDTTEMRSRAYLCTVCRRQHQS